MNLRARRGATILALITTPTFSFLQTHTCHHPVEVAQVAMVTPEFANEQDMKRDASYYRSDGVRITHDPYAPGMAEKYGLPGNTDKDGFDPYADTVGPGIYSGSVKRDPETSEVIIGAQYQNHNHRPGPVYDGNGYSLMPWGA